MAVIPNPLVIRRVVIVRKLKKCGAVSPETAKTLAEAGVPNPNAFPKIPEILVKRGVIHQTPDGKYYL